ncbi:MAG: hypothetical protein R2751_18935 [Bacteroidales bacterium]
MRHAIDLNNKDPSDHPLTSPGLLGGALPVPAQTWIWFPGDYENWLGNRMNNRRTEQGVSVPVQWKLDKDDLR